MSNVFYLNKVHSETFVNEDKKEGIGVQRFYIFHEKYAEVRRSTIDINALFDLFKNKYIALTEESFKHLDQGVISAVNDFYADCDDELKYQQLLTITALFCFHSKTYEEFKHIHPDRDAGFSYFVTIIENNAGEYVLKDKILPFDNEIFGDLLDDILDGIIKNHKNDMAHEGDASSTAQ